MVIQGGSPNLINGVSRQPAEIRLPSQLEESVNQYPSVIKGLVPRPPSLFRYKDDKAPGEHEVYHVIDRDKTERYVVRVDPTPGAPQVTVHDLDGNEYTVAAPDGFNYISGASREDLQLLTVADHTFILNNKRSVNVSAQTSDDPVHEAMVHIVTGEYHTVYEIEIDDVVVARYGTSGGPFEDAGDAQAAERGARPGNIAEVLITGTDVLNTIDDPNITNIGLEVSLGTTDWVFTQIDNVIHITRVDGADFSIRGKSIGSEQAMRVHKGIVESLALLPKKASPDFVIKVRGDRDTEYDDYYVKFVKETNDGVGVWKETIGPAVVLGLQKATMPHVLVREASGSFTFRQGDWENRSVGDVDTIPDPSFVDHNINGFVFHKNRLGLISGESVCFSRNGKPFNFFKESVLTLLDTDPVDITVSHDDIANIRHAVPFSGQLLLFTDTVPFKITSGDIFSTTSVSFDPVLFTKSVSTAKPAAAGNVLFFANDSPEGAFIHEMFFEKDSGLADAPPVSEHVDGYLPKEIAEMVVDQDIRMMFLRSEDDDDSKRRLWLYKWLIKDRQKLQSAWQTWEFNLDTAIKAMKFIEHSLFLVLEYNDSIDLVEIPCHEAWDDRDRKTPIMLDRRVEVVGVYNFSTGETEFEVPYDVHEHADSGFEGHAPPILVYITPASVFGALPDTINYLSDRKVSIPGGWNGRRAYVGFAFDSYCVPSTFKVRDRNTDGSEGNAKPGARVRLGRFYVDTGPSTYLDVTLTRAFRAPYTQRYTAAFVGQDGSGIGSIPYGNIKVDMSILQDAEEISLKLAGVGPYYYSLLSNRWTGDAYTQGY